MNRNVIAGAVGVGVLLLVGLGAYGMWSRPPAKPPNVLIILWDTARADRMSVYGYEIDTTPRIKAWADKYGVVYERAVSPDMWTVPSHASLFTGLAPSTHGAHFDHRWLDADNVTLAEWFGQHGWETYAFSANPNLSPSRVNLLQGFSSVDTSWSRKWRAAVVQHTQDKLIRRDKSTEISPGGKRKHGGTGFYNAAGVTHDAFTRWLDLRADPEQPFFAYLSYMEAHKPRVPSIEARRRVADDATIRLGLDTDLSFKNQLFYSYEKMAYTPEELRAINAVYDATLVELDDLTGDLLDDLEARGILEDTVVVFTADHGEQLGTHQQFGHRTGVYQALLHVPLIVAYPRKLRPQRVQTPVSNLSLYASIVDLAGVPQPDTGFFRTTLAQAVASPSAVFSETLSIDRLGFGKVKKAHPDLGRDVWANTYRAVIEGPMKLIESVSFDTHDVVDRELFDLSVDPHEEHDLSEVQPEKVAALQAAFATWSQAQPKWDPAKGDEVVENLSDAEKRQLELLGYLSDDEAIEEPAPGEPAPGKPAPGEPAPGEPAPGEPEPTERAPAAPVP